MRRIGLSLVLVAGAVSGAGGCRSGVFTEDELVMLRTLAIGGVPVPADTSSAVSDDGAAAVLGKKLFFEPRFSGALGPANDGATDGSLGVAGDAGRISCASCHDLQRGGADHRSSPAQTSLGGGYTLRNAPSIINAAYSPLWQFWDGRRDSLWSQALSPMENANEANGNRLAIAALIADKYRADYEAVFGPMPDLSALPRSGKPGEAAFDGLGDDRRVDVNRIFANVGKAIAAYERRLTSNAFAPSALEQFLQTGDETALSPAAIRGARLFIGRAGCVECHGGPTLSDNSFHNIGVPQKGVHVPVEDLGRFSGVGQLLADETFTRFGAFSETPAPDDELVLAPDGGQVGRFKTPSLRNVAKTAPYMHDGAYGDLWSVVTHYNFAGATEDYAGERDVALSPLLLSDAELGDLVEFLGALSDGDPEQSPDFPEGLVAAPTLPP